MSMRTFERRLAQRGQWLLLCSVLVFALACWAAVRVVRVWRHADVYRVAEVRRALDSLAQSLDTALQPELLAHARGGFTTASVFSCVRIVGNDGTPLLPRWSRVFEPVCAERHAPLIRQCADRIDLTRLTVAAITGAPPIDMPDVPGGRAAVGIELGWRLAADAFISNDVRRARAVYQLMRDQFPVQLDLAGFPVRLTAWLEDARWCSDKAEQDRLMRQWRDEVVLDCCFTNVPQARAVVITLLRRANDIAGADAAILSLTNALFPTDPPTRELRDGQAVYRVWLEPRRAVELARSCWLASASVAASNAGVSVRLRTPDEPEPVGAAVTTNLMGICVSVVPCDAVAWQARRTQNAMLTLALLAGVMLAAAILFWRTLLAMAAEKRLRSRELNFVAAVSHELRSPISSVKVLAEAMERGLVTDPQEQQSFARMIVDESNRLGRLVNNILDVARGPGADLANKMEAVPVRGLLDAAARVPAGMKDARITVDCPEGLVVHGVKPMIERAVCNLVENALKYRRREGECIVALTAAAVAGMIEIRVADNGMGIPRHEHDRIFERFYRVGDELVREQPGAGLGLAIVKEIVEAHGGSVAVESVEGKGSTFIVRLPLAPEPEP